jgi:hypothetical protein
MSLAIINASSNIAQSIVRHLARRGDFERIVCADLYPNYWAIERFVNFKHNLAKEGLKTKLEDIHYSSKSDLERIIHSNSHLLYVTHDYFSVAPSKISLFKTVSELSKTGLVKKTIAVLPMEYDHYSEPNPTETAIRSEEEARSINPDMIQIKTDLTFGPYCEIIHQLLVRIAQKRNLHFHPSVTSPVPIDTENIAEAVHTLLTGDIKGENYLA